MLRSSKQSNKPVLLRVDEVEANELINDTMKGREPPHQSGGDFFDSWGWFLQPAHIRELNFMSFPSEGHSFLFWAPSCTVAISQC